jgi:hypothetical protein
MSENSIHELQSWDIQRAVRDCPPWILNSYEKLMMFILVSRGDDIFPSMTLLEHDMAASRKTVNNTKKSLVDKRWLTYEQGNAGGHPNHYQPTVPGYVGRSQTFSKAGTAYVSFQYPGAPGPGELEPWKRATSIPQPLVATAQDESPSIPGKLDLVSVGNYPSIPGKLDLVSVGNSKSKRKREIEEDNLSPNAPSSQEDLSLPSLANISGSATELASQEEVVEEVESISSASLGFLKQPATRAAQDENVPPSIPGKLGKQPAPFEDVDTPDPKKEHWLKNESTKKFWPAFREPPSWWVGAKTRDFYFTTLERVILRDQGRLDYHGTIPTKKEDY